MRIVLTISPENSDNENHSQLFAAPLRMRIILTVPATRSPLAVRPVVSGRSPYLWGLLWAAVAKVPPYAALDAACLSVPHAIEPAHHAARCANV